MFKLSELYLIAAECAEDEDAYGYLNKLRNHRGLSSIEHTKDIESYIYQEYRREFLGEGQLFFLYKRLNRPLVMGADIDMIGTKAYTFPLPISETDASQRETNR